MCRARRASKELSSTRRINTVDARKEDGRRSEPIRGHVVQQRNGPRDVCSDTSVGGRGTVGIDPCRAGIGTKGFDARPSRRQRFSPDSCGSQTHVETIQDHTTETRVGGCLVRAIHGTRQAAFARQRFKGKSRSSITVRVIKARSTEQAMLTETTSSSSRVGEMPRTLSNMCVTSGTWRSRRVDQKKTTKNRSQHTKRAAQYAADQNKSAACVSRNWTDDDRPDSSPSEERRHE